MVLEATVLVLDNSEWMRNGDYTPTRMEAQSDAVTFLFNAKTQSNPENTVGLMTMAGKSPEVLVTLTPDIGKILTALHNIRIAGKVNLSTGVQIAQLALKHRQNKNQRQRIVVFVGSPLEEDEKTLVRLGKKLKKNNVAVDIVNFGEESENTQKLEAFVAAVNSNDNSHLVSIPPGPHILSDVLLTSPIVAGEDGAPPGFASGSGFEFGVDPNLDPELALALRISMEEERARQEAANRGGAEGAAGGDAMVVDSAFSAPTTAAGGSTEEEDMLQQALAMSMGQQPGGAAMDVELSEEEQMARAIAMSMSQGGDQAADMNSIISSLPGVNMDDPRLRAALEGGSKAEEKKDGEDKNKK
ncbi:proteasome regulatory particle base subunit RPN10 [Spizellomyces punctatus DAOM BR117]|uniref:VWFA domain-containing protein n=1 Tax=Spizellomyces punctatus (strain DAOM BR117) TaxID=645134 RepID=A0A0L0HKQ9_SPIPD|nr:proteasome regulatory particle base subunit RPN10 [Spizellomyces punctatus DAOM BR117]KND01682.1 hypothetical protein SPPG_03477 [Spizellomyces punctatus DAOM BR117]|eukprot:XP_016609721.1 hypothetical protein SPPG_03477 [Spizellomyces punctatus DAOM BR117]